MSDIKLLIGADIKELEQKLAVAKAKLISFGQDGPRALIPLQQRLSGLTFPTKQIEDTGNKIGILGQLAQKSSVRVGEFAGRFIAGGLIGAITATGAALIQLGNNMFDITSKQKLLNEVIDGAKSAYIKAVLEVDKVGDAFRKAREGIISKESALQIYNSTIGKTIGQTDDLNLAEKNLNDNAQNYIQYTLLKAAANIALSKAADAAFQAEAERIKGVKNVTAFERVSTVKLNFAALSSLDFEKAFKMQTAEQIVGKRMQKFIDVQKEMKLIYDSLNEQVKKIGFTEVEEANKTTAAINKKTAAQKEYVKEISKIKFTLNDEDTKLIDEEAGAKALESAIEKLLKNLKGGNAIGIPVDLELDPNIKIDGDQARQGFIKELTTAGISTTDRVLENGIKIKIPVQIGTVNELIAEISKFKKNAQDELQELDEVLSDTVKNIINGTISSVAEGVADALSGGKDVVPRLFDNIIKGIGEQIKELGKYLVRVGVAKLGIDRAIRALGLNPAAAIAVGVAAQILGSLLVSQATKKSSAMGKGFATGVRDLQEGGVYSVGERGPETIYLPRGSSVRPNNEVNAYGGGSQVFIPAVSLRGSDLVIAFNRASQSMSRNS